MDGYKLYHTDDSGRKVDLSDKQKELADQAKDRSAEKIAKAREDDPGMTDDEYMLEEYADDHDEYLVDGARLKCSHAIREIKVIQGKIYRSVAPDTTTVLKVTENPKAKCCGYLYHATVKDRKVKDNIPPFRCNCDREPHNEKEWAKLEADETCLYEGTCKALIDLEDEWDNLPTMTPYLSFGNDGDEESISGITMSSMLFCKHGGLITPVTSGQTTKLCASNLNLAWYNYNETMLSKINAIDPKYNDLIKQFKEAYEKNKSRYMRLAKQMGIPPEMLAVIHYRENSSDYLQGGFNVYLHNGQTLGQITTKAPKNKLYYDFDTAALNAIAEKAQTISDLGMTYDTRDITAMLCFLETYNGLGYYYKNRVNPYLYSGTNVYISGKYVADGVYDPNAVDEQAGAYILLDALL